MWTIIAIIAIIAVYVVSVYNGLVARRNQAHEAFATIDTQLKRRYDLIPNLVASVKGAAKHESGTLQAVITARNAAMSAKGANRGAAETKLADALKSVFALAESYPALQANANFMELQRELADTETKIQSARQFYNTVVMNLNTQIDQFPSSIIAGWFKIAHEKLFEMADTERKAPKVEF